MSVTSEPLNHPLTKKFSTALSERYKNGFVVISPGNFVMPQEFMLDAQRIIDFPVFKDDVWLVTFPKSGTTWTQEMVWLLMNDFDYDTAKKICVTKRFPYLEHMSIMPEVTRKDIPDSISLAANQPSPRLIKSHLPPALLPKQLWTVKPKIIYVARNPKDAATSFYYHNRLIHDLQMTLDDYLEAFLENSVPFTPYWTSVLEFWKLRNEPNILWNTYEEMKENLGAVIRKTAAFLGKSVSGDELRRLSEHLSFRNMRDNPATNYSGVVEAARQRLQLPPAPANLSFMRQGGEGGGGGDAKQRMAPGTSRRFDSWAQDHVQGTDYGGPL